jgi:hypothetical protein
MTTPITSVPGIGRATAFALAQHGFRTAEDLALADEEALTAISGFGLSRSATLVASARKLVGAQVQPTDARGSESAGAALGVMQDQVVKKKSKEKKKKKKEKDKEKKGKKKDKKKKGKKGEKKSKN